MDSMDIDIFHLRKTYTQGGALVPNNQELKCKNTHEGCVTTWYLLHPEITETANQMVSKPELTDTRNMILEGGKLKFLVKIIMVLEMIEISIF